jgi:hypothetical protein
MSNILITFPSKEKVRVYSQSSKRAREAKATGKKK